MKTICKWALSSITVLLLFISVTPHAQVKFGENKTTISAGSLLELESSASPYKAVLFPRISLSTTTTWALNGSGVAGMMLYNTNASVTSSNILYPVLTGGIGMYFWDGNGWVGMTFPYGVSNGQFWNLKGNSGTNSATNFVGTTTDRPLVFKVNGQLAGYLDSSTGYGSTFFGYLAGVNTAAANNTFFGNKAGQTNSSGTSNLFAGSFAGQANTSGGANTLIGMYAGLNNSTGSSNTFTGMYAGLNNSTGSNNTFIGYNASSSSGNFSKAAAFGYRASVSASNSLVLGGTGADAVNVGIGTTAPQELFQVGDASANTPNPVILLQSNANTSGSGGILRFREQGYPGSNYGIDIRHSTGSAGVTNEGLYFDRVVAGTTTNAVFIDEGNGRLGVGTANPSQNIHIAGTTTVGNIGTTGTHTNTPTERIDGLSSANNTVHVTGDVEPRPVYATRNGDLIIAPSDSVLVSTDDFITTNVPVNVPGNGTGINSVSSTISPNPAPVFTLARRAVMQISYSITALFQLNSTTSVTDGIVRASICKFDIFNTGTSATVKAGIGTSSSYYTNTNAAGNTATVLGGYAYNNGTYNIELAAGSYSLIFTLTGATGSGVGAYITFGGGLDMLQVVAHYK